METITTKILHLTPDGDKDKHMMKSQKRDILVEKISDDGQSITFNIENHVLISHTEHDLLVLNSGRYSKTNQVEFNPFDNTVAYVFD